MQSASSPRSATLKPMPLHREVVPATKSNPGSIEKPLAGDR